MVNEIVVLHSTLQSTNNGSYDIYQLIRVRVGYPTLYIVLLKMPIKYREFFLYAKGIDNKIKIRKELILKPVWS